MDNLSPEESAVLYRTLTENLPGIVYRVYLRENLHMQFFNEMLEQLTGYRPEELYAGEVCSIDPLIPLEDRARVVGIVNHAILENIPFEVEYRLKHKNGEFRHLWERGRPVIGADGQPLFIDGVIFDVSIRKQMEEDLRQAWEELELRVRERTKQFQASNERLRRVIEQKQKAEENTRSERQKLLTILDAIPAQILLLKSDFFIAFANYAFRSRFGESEGKRCHELIFGRNRPCDFCQTGGVFKTKRPLAREVTDAQGRIYRAYDYPLTDQDGSVLVMQIGIDITERKHSEIKLRKSETRLAEAERIAHLGHWEWSIPTDEVVWSDETYRIFQLNPQKFRATYENFLNRVHSEDRDMIESNLTSALAGRKPYSIDHRIMLPDGTVRWVHGEAVVSFDEAGAPVRMMGTVQDITRQHQKDETLRDSEQRLRYLASQLMNAQERERKRISQELHDELGQSLQVLRLKVGAAKPKIRPDQHDLQNHCQELLAYLNGVIESVRRLSRDLSPAVLDDLGLSAAIRFLLEEHCKYYGTKDFVQEIDEIDQCFLPQAQLDLYRIFQESLNNIGKHAQASRVMLNIKRRGKQVSFRLEDNGRGFDLEKLFSQGASEKGLGIAAIEERVRRLGGNLEVWSKKGKGTRITFEVPVETEEGA